MSSIEFARKKCRMEISGKRNLWARNWVAKISKMKWKTCWSFFFVSLLEKVLRKINVKLNRIKREKLLNFKAKNFCNVVSFRRKNIMKSSSYARQNSDFQKCLSLKCVLYLSTSRAMPSRLPSNKYPCSTESQQLSDASWSHSGLGSKIPPLFSFTVKTWLNVNCFVRECALLRNGRGLRASSFCVGLMFFLLFLMSIIVSFRSSNSYLISFA